MAELYSLYPEGIHDPAEIKRLWKASCQHPFRDLSLFHRLSLPLEKTIGTSWRHFSTGMEEEIVAIESFHGRLYPVFRKGKAPWYALGTYRQTSHLYVDAYVPVAGETDAHLLAWATTSLRFYEQQIRENGPGDYTTFVQREVLPLIRSYRTDLAQILGLPQDDELDAP